MTPSSSSALIFGGSRGFGAQLAGRLAETGWRVTATGRREDPDLPPAVRYLRCDFTASAGQRAALDCCTETLPDLVVVNSVSYGEIGAATPAQDSIDDVFRVNATVPYRLLLTHLRERPADRFCSVVVVNSDAIYHAAESAAVYAASKAALRVLTSALAAACRTRNASVSTLLLGPLGDDRKRAELRAIAERRGVSEDEITRVFLRRSNPSFVTDALIELDACVRSVDYIVSLGRSANGMLCRLDGGSAGSLV